MTQDTQTPQQPRWEASGHAVFALRDSDLQFETISEYEAETLAAYLNAQQQRIQAAEKVAGRNAELIADSLDDVLQWRTIADEATDRIQALEAALRRQTTLANEVLGYMAQDYVRISSSVPAEFRLLVHQACEEWDRAVETAVALLSSSEAI